VVRVLGFEERVRDRAPLADSVTTVGFGVWVKCLCEDRVLDGPASGGGGLQG